MTKKHFAAIARALRQSKPSCHAPLPAFIAWGDTTVILADTLAGFNFQFDRGRFYDACNFDPELHAGWKR